MVEFPVASKSSSSEGSGPAPAIGPNDCSADVVVLVALEHTHVQVGLVPAQPWALRVTLVFRKKGDRCLLAHRHADPLVWPIDATQSAALARAR
jgi:hypothetical protein